MTDDRWIAGRNVPETRDVGEITSFQKLYEVAVLMITLPCRQLCGKLFNTGHTNSTRKTLISMRRRLNFKITFRGFVLLFDWLKGIGKSSGVATKIPDMVLVLSTGNCFICALVCFDRK